MLESSLTNLSFFFVYVLVGRTCKDDSHAQWSSSFTDVDFSKIVKADKKLWDSKANFIYTCICDRIRLVHCSN